MTETGTTVIDCKDAEKAKEALERFLRDLMGRVAKKDAELLKKTFLTVFTSSDEEEREEAIQLAAEILCDSKGHSPLTMWRLPRIEEDGPVKDPGLRAWVQHVAGRIKSLRQEKGWTQEDLATRTGLSQSHLSRIEQCYHAPSHKTLTRIAKELGISVGDLDPVD